MSLTIDPPAAPDVAPERPAAPPVPPRPAVLWGMVGLAVALLATSATVRYWQSRGVDEALRQGLKSPFELKELPMTLGDWKGTDEPLDPAIARATGCSDSVFRTYSNEKTGARVSLILLYGPAEEVSIHSPDNCYPAAGYGLVGGVERRNVEAGKSRYPFESMVYIKGEGGRTERQEVYCTWRYSGQWNPARAVMKKLERLPGMYKVHVTRQVVPGELREVGNPCESLLAELMPWVDRRLAESASPTSTAAR